MSKRLKNYSDPVEAYVEVVNKYGADALLKMGGATG